MDDLRAIVISPKNDLVYFRQSLAEKFGLSSNRFEICFKDEDGDRVNIKDNGDWDAAIECARYVAAGRPEGKLEVWVRW